MVPTGVYAGRWRLIPLFSLLSKGAPSGLAGCKGMVDSERIVQNLAIVRERIASAARKSGRNPEDVTLVAVTKTRGTEHVRAVVEAGVVDVGENYVQEAAEKAAQLRGLPCRWHFIGHLQRNKVKQALGFAHLIHTLDSLRLAEEIARRAESLGVCAPCLVEVNVSGEATKRGIAPAELLPLYEGAAAMSALQLDGLMTMAPFSDDPEDARPVFAALRTLAAELRDQGLPAKRLSMGMTSDLEVAVEEGATIVRVGTALFGPRSA